MSDANKIQVGGQHYKTGTFEHWDWTERQGIGYLEGCASKYVARFRDKGGRQDLQKAVHYVDKLIELHRATSRRNRATFIDYTLCEVWYKAMKLNAIQTQILEGLLRWQGEEDLLRIKMWIMRLEATEYPD